MTSLTEKIVALHQALRAANLPHAFGGALALAWCTQRARGTIDIDVNIFVDTDQAGAVLSALPAPVRFDDASEKALLRDGQVRLWWDNTPVDVFLDTTPFHGAVFHRTRWESFAGTEIPFLSCHDIAVFKTFFDRTRDWADLEEMRDAGTLDVGRVTAVLIEYLGTDDRRIRKLEELRAARTP
ncbi:MAG: hypothetical protein P8R42_10490 [Candidatus Binatia bacterium]|nr:hypothetical protein [Candidatus Binatia bacterium]